ncbi:MAG: hypothetical protein J1F18_05190 [Lachnospiraceae bacterium]|nr:hypothetical protein [Lachnospiraceae bacterium]
MRIKNILVLSITGLFLWSACVGTVNAEGDIKGGFIKENGEYLIESGEQLELLSKMVANREEIEPGVDAATASYRLCNDVVVRDRLKIGSRRSPFFGDFNGDGYKIVGDSNFFIATKYRYDETGQQINIEEYVRYNLVEEQPIYIDLEDWRTLEEAAHRLMSVPKESLYISVLDEELSLNETARRVKLCWDVNRHRNHYSVKIVDVGPLRPTEDSDALIPFLDLFGEETGAIMRQTAEDEDSYISFLRLEHVGGLDICTFAVRASEREQYHVLVTGEWEDTGIGFQHLVVPATGDPGVLNCGISQVDINYDGQDDLLINEGFSGGSGGSWGVYRALVWEDTAEEFVWYPSFPTHLVCLEFNEKRMITRYRMGAGHEAVREYRVVDGEYAETREVVWESEPDGSAVLSYYEMETLVAQHDVSGLDKDEFAEFYPDLDYWFLP